MTKGLFTLTLIAALGCALMAGVLFAFSAFVMHALARLPPAQGIAAMQSINVSAVRPAFMTGLFGTAAISSTRSRGEGAAPRRTCCSWAWRSPRSATPSCSA